jgi:hypothetical protein
MLSIKCLLFFLGNLHSNLRIMNIPNRCYLWGLFSTPVSFSCCNKNIIRSRVIHKVTLSSPSLCASFHPRSPLSVVSAK